MIVVPWAPMFLAMAMTSYAAATTIPGMERPRGISFTAALMCACNALGWFTVDWHKPQAMSTFAVFTMLILIGYLFLWFYWKGYNWARIAVLLTSVLTIYNLRYWREGKTANRFMIGVEALLGIFLLFWLNTSRIREYFKAGGRTVEPVIKA